MTAASALFNQMASASFENNDGDQPDYVTIFQTMDNMQILLPELGDRYALQAYFHFHGVRFLLDQRTNAEDMSPDGLLPFIRHGNDLVSGYGKIIEYVNTKNSIDYSSQSRPDIIALTVLFNEVVIKAELYYTWLAKEIYDQFTKSHFPNGKPWPLTFILCWLKKWDVASVSQGISEACALIFFLILTVFQFVSIRNWETPRISILILRTCSPICPLV